MPGSRSSVCRRTLSGGLLCLLLPGGAYSQSPPNTNAQTKNEARVKQRALTIPLGWPVQVNLNNRDRLYGRMGQITDQGFVLQYLNSGKIDERTIAFSEVNRIYLNRRGRVSRKFTAAMMALSFIPVGIALGFAAAR